MKKLANRRNKRTNYSIIIFLELLKYRDGEADLGSGIRDPRDPGSAGSEPLGIRDPGYAFLGSGIRGIRDPAMKQDCFLGSGIRVFWDPGHVFFGIRDPRSGIRAMKRENNSAKPGYRWGRTPGFACKVSF